jgi:hypothetical protein
MPSIPMGNFGQSTIQPGRAPRLSADGGEKRVLGEALAAAGKQLGDTATARIAADTKETLDELERQQSNDAATASLKFESAAKSKLMDYSARVESGQIEPDEADRLWREEVSQLRADTVGGLRTSLGGRTGTRIADAASLRADRVIEATSLQLGAAVHSAKQGRFAAQAAGALDELGKQAVMPGEDIGSIFSKADAVFPVMAQRAGVSPEKAAEKLQTWKDNARFQRARIDLVGSRRSLESLDAFTQRLESGDLAGTLDADKRTMLVKEAESHRWQIQQAQQHAIDKREKVAERAVGAVTRQIEAAVPVTVEAWQDLRTKVEGTAFSADFNALVGQEREVQKVLRLPVGQQEAYVQQREAALMQDGGTMADKANLQRIKATIETNKKELEQAPLLAAQRLLGRKVEPLNLADLLAPGGTHRAASLFADRAATLQAMSRQFGAKVGERPLLPQEKDALVAGLELASPSEAVTLFGSLRSAIDDDVTYRAAMQQLAPDSPVKARAGILAASGHHRRCARAKRQDCVDHDVR